MGLPGRARHRRRGVVPRGHGVARRRPHDGRREEGSRPLQRAPVPRCEGAGADRGRCEAVAGRPEGRRAVRPRFAVRDRRRLQHLRPHREVPLPAGRRDHGDAADRVARRRLVDCVAPVLLLRRVAAVAGAVALVVAGGAGARTTALPPLPPHWPASLQIGSADSPGGAAALRRAAPFGFRYQYLAGGVNTGSGWSTWNPGGTFASMYVQDSWAHNVVPVLTYYMLLQSKPGGGDEAHADLANLQNAATMSAYWADVKLLFSRIRGTKPVVVHVEPDLWGYLEQANAVDLASSFAQKWIALRDAGAPNAILAYHISGWGPKHDIVYQD